MTKSLSSIGGKDDWTKYLRFTKVYVYHHGHNYIQVFIFSKTPTRILNKYTLKYYKLTRKFCRNRLSRSEKKAFDLVDHPIFAHK